MPDTADLGRRVEALASLAAAPDILALSREAGLALPAAGQLWDAVASGFALDKLRAAAGGVDPRGRFTGRAVAAVADDLAALQRRLAGAVLAGADGAKPVEAVARFRSTAGARAAAAAALVDEAAGAPDLAAIVVAGRIPAPNQDKNDAPHPGPLPQRGRGNATGQRWP